MYLNINVYNNSGNTFISTFNYTDFDLITITDSNFTSFYSNYIFYISGSGNKL